MKRVNEINNKKKLLKKQLAKVDCLNNEKNEQINILFLRVIIFER